VGSISTNLSLSDVAGAVDAVRILFLTLGTAFLVISRFGFGFAVLRITGARFFGGAGATDFFSTGPVPFRPSMTMVPFCVYTWMQAFSTQSAACAEVVKDVRNIAQISNLFMRGRVGLGIVESRRQKAICG